MSKFVLILTSLLLIDSCHEPEARSKTASNLLPFTKRISKTEREWRSQLSKKEYYILREKGTERPFSGSLLYNKKKGIYICAGCGHELFSSKSKYESGTGWPSFYEPYSKTSLAFNTDDSYGMEREEILCARCGGHLGHVFNDGPHPTGLRYCINSIALKFVRQKHDRLSPQM